MKQLLFVFLGGGIGSMLRYGITKYLNNLESLIPYGTLTVNILGSLLIGFIFGLTLKSHTISENTLLFLVTGICGGFTTFSAFSYDNYSILKNGAVLQFSIYSLGSIVIGILAVFLGIWIAKLF